eukprot:CAMPEP_0182530238 /NCGR_PEP_ID=MMETSP1323-20130603/5762_1 /TAXON_ID=236787 /ORGANISM="Florenciella parvula, Strain RCC1693" /LENGTH=421 /DNA_ID=CAMNT_0024739527 /DNA_START=21 /DNA_END=1286 /DNA_ORIENTATION=-
MKRLQTAAVAALCVAVVVVEAGKKRGKKGEDPVSPYPEMSKVQADVVEWATNPMIYGSLVCCFAVLAIGWERKNEFAKEFLGTILMVVCTFTPGPYFGHLKGYEEWLAHMAGVIVADYLCGGPHVNPAVTTAMFVWRKISLLQWIVYVAAQVAGGIVAFPFVQALSTPYGVTIGGPGIAPGTTFEDAVWSEGAATFVLLMGIFIFCTTWIGQIYPVKQPIVAAVIRGCIVYFGKTGPAINPMLGTTWAFYVSGMVWPSDASHYIVYWLAPMLAASVATLLWSCFTLTGPFEPHRPSHDDGHAPGSLQATWDHHFKAFGDKSAMEVIKDYTESSILIRYDSATGKKTEAAGVAKIRAAFEALFHELKDLKGLNAPVIELDKTSRTVYLVWSCPTSGIKLATDSFVMDEDFKIIRQYLTVEHK